MPSINRYKPRKQPMQSRSRATYDAILDAAAQVLADEGYPASTTNKIAERAGASIGSVYEYFPSKEAIFTALIERLDQYTAESVIDNFANIGQMKPEAFLETVLRSRIEAALNYPELESLLRTEIPASLFIEQAEKTYQRFSEGMKLFANTYPQLIRVRHLDTAIELGSVIVESTIRSLANSYPERLEDEILVQEFIDVMTRYILKN
jgi:AcrR family transcriptional regulator